MGQILHGCARTTATVRRAIQHSQESLRTLARRHGVNPKTITKWRKRTSVADRKTGSAPKSTVLSLQQEAVAPHEALGSKGWKAGSRVEGA